MSAILFVCIGNACRSQMAEGWLRHVTRQQDRPDIKVYSAGSAPLGHIPDETKAVMLEAGIDISDQWSKSVNELPPTKLDYVISLCGDRCPYVSSDQHIDWVIPDPIGQPIEVYRQVRDLLKARVNDFFQNEILNSNKPNG